MWNALDLKTLWHAAEQLNGFVSDDGFEYFRAWVIAQGRKVYTKALADSSTLMVFNGTLKKGDYELEELLNAARTKDS